ncbi:MAG: glycosyltransferase family 2 protein [Candidatus Methanoperedens sp.]|nr:glycosyltransferase family 2 protein [Candidatus Methanoperedens sp.]
MISIIVPAYNEEKRIQGMLELYVEYFFEKYRDCELIVVADGSDRTATIVQNMIAKFPGIHLLEFGTRLGKGGGIVEGFKAARGTILAFVDADDSVSPSDLDRIIGALDTVDCAIGSRRAPGAMITRHQPLKREVISRVFNVMVNLMFNLGIRDTQCGAKAFKKKTVDLVVPKIRSNGFEFDVELLWRIKKHGFSILEVPIEWKHSEHSRFSLKHAPRMFANLMSIRCEQKV